MGSVIPLLGEGLVGVEIALRWTEIGAEPREHEPRIGPGPPLPDSRPRAAPHSGAEAGGV